MAEECVAAVVEWLRECDPAAVVAWAVVWAGQCVQAEAGEVPDAEAKDSSVIEAKAVEWLRECDPAAVAAWAVVWARDCIQAEAGEIPGAEFKDSSEVEAKAEKCAAAAVV